MPWWTRRRGLRRLAMTPAAAPVLASEATWGDRVSQYARLITGLLSVVTILANLIVAEATNLPLREIGWVTAIAAVTGALSTLLTRDTELIVNVADEVEEIVHRDRS